MHHSREEKKKANKTYIFKNCRNASSSSNMSSTCPDFRADAVYAACPSPLTLTSWFCGTKSSPCRRSAPPPCSVTLQAPCPAPVSAASFPMCIPSQNGTAP